MNHNNPILKKFGKKWAGVRDYNTYMTIRFMPKKKVWAAKTTWSTVEYQYRTVNHIKNAEVQFDTIFDAACYVFTKQPI